ncbi:MAG: c-type cytochrome [Planctomycetota bacterium]|nr:c-type cytochrome [Planctomycetota bacterium]
MQSSRFRKAVTISVGVFLFFQDKSHAEHDPARDTLIVETLIRLDKTDVEDNEKLKSAVLRHLDTNEGTERYIDLIQKFSIHDRDNKLVELALKGAGPLSVQALKILLNRKAIQPLEGVFQGTDDEKKAVLIRQLGFANTDTAREMIAGFITDKKYNTSFRSKAAEALASTPKGQRQILELVKNKTLPDDLHFAVANLLLTSTDASIQQEASMHLKLPQTLDNKPLPPLTELVEMKGDATNGKKVFSTICAACHKLGDTGIEFGPSLAEIGNKLAKDGLYSSILDPSAAVSHGFDGYILNTNDDDIAMGYVVSETKEDITLKMAGGISSTFKNADIKTKKKMEVSLMPANLQMAMKRQDLIDLVEFLTTLKK